MKRGDIVTVAAPGDYGKPRPAIVIQSDFLNQTHASIMLCLMTSELVQAPLFRIDVSPSPENGLQKPSQIMVDKILTVRRERIGKCIGRLEGKVMRELERARAFVLGLAD